MDEGFNRVCGSFTKVCTNAPNPRSRAHQHDRVMLWGTFLSGVRWLKTVNSINKVYTIKPCEIV